VDDFFGVGVKGGFCSEYLEIDVGQARGGALRGQVAYDGWVQAVVIGECWDLDAAAVGQVGDVAVVADIAHKTEGVACCDRFYDVRAVFDASFFDFGGFELEGVMFCVFFGDCFAPVVIGSAFTAEAWFVAVQLECGFIFAEPGDIFAEVSGAFCHKIAEVAKDFAADFFIFVVMGFFEEFSQLWIEVASFVFEL